MLLDYLVSEHDFWEFKHVKKYNAEISKWILNWEKITLLKPQTFMNLSGESIKKIVDFYKFSSKDFVVIYDDFSMDFWKIRSRDTGSSGWHNWIKNIIKYFWKDFKRIKIWVWFNEQYDVSDWVLSKFKKEESDELQKNIFKKCFEDLCIIVAD